MWNAIAGVEDDLLRLQRGVHLSPGPAVLRRPDARAATALDIHGARILAILGDSVTTTTSPRADRETALQGIPQARGRGEKDFNTYGARRGNDRVMARATFANIRLKNLMLPGVEGAGDP